MVHGTLHGTLHIFFRKKPFLFVKIKSWNFQHLFNYYFVKPLKISAHSEKHSDDIFLRGIRVVRIRNELKFWEVLRNNKSKRCWKFQISILTNKKVLFLKKIWSVPCTMDSSFFSQQMPYCLLTLLVYMDLTLNTSSANSESCLYCYVNFFSNPKNAFSQTKNK